MNTQETYDIAHKHLAYETGTGYLIRKIGRRGPNARAGDIAGHIHNKGYVRVYLMGKQYGAHRLVFLMNHGHWPNHIDHINGVKHDNRLDNLRDVGYQENTKNKAMRKDNKSGQMGVFWNTAREKWMAVIGVIPLGAFVDKEEAIKARKAAEIEYGYHENHGRKSV